MTASAATRVASEPALRLSWGGARFAVFCAEYVVQTKGRWAGQPLYLEPWQLAWESEMLRTSSEVELEFGPRQLDLFWRHPDLFYERLARRLRRIDAEPGLRLYREGYVQMAKKTGKSTIASSHALYFLIADGERGPEVYSAASAKDQARIVFGQAKEAVEASPKLLDWLRVYRDSLYVPSTGGVYRVLAADAGHQEGLNPHATVIDELHRHKSRDLYDTLTSGDIAREQPFTLIITNAGSDLDSICGEVYLQAKAVLAGLPSARRDLFAYVPELEEHELEDREAWMRVNAASWITVDVLERQRAKFPPWVFQRRYLNRWTAADENWLPEGAWDECGAEDEIPPGTAVVVAVDMGQRHDTAAIVIGATINGRQVVRAQSWGVWRDPEKPPPPVHEAITDADRVAFDLVENAVRELARTYELREVAYDPWRFARSAEALEAEGIPMVEIPQTNERMCPATQQLFDLIVQRRLAHDGDPVLKAHVLAAVPKDTGRGWRLTKRPARSDRAQQPVDLAIALVLVTSRLSAGDAGPAILWLD